MASPADRQRLGHERAIDALLWVLAALSAASTLWLSLGPVPPSPAEFPGADKAFHGLVYFVTTLLLLFAAVWRPGRGPGSLARFAPALIAGIVCSGLVIEVLQRVLTDNRQLEFADWLADAAGALAAAAVHGLVRRLGAEAQPERQRHSATSG